MQEPICHLLRVCEGIKEAGQGKAPEIRDVMNFGLLCGATYLSSELLGASGIESSIGINQYPMISKPIKTAASMWMGSIATELVIPALVIPFFNN